MNRNISFYMKKPNYCCSLPSHSHQSQKNKKQKTLQCPEPHPRTLNFSFFTSQTTSAEANQEFCFSFISVGFSYANTPNFWFFFFSLCVSRLKSKAEIRTSHLAEGRSPKRCQENFSFPIPPSQGHVLLGSDFSFRINEHTWLSPPSSKPFNCCLILMKCG